MGHVLILDQYRDAYAQRRMYTHATSNLVAALSPMFVPYSIAFMWLSTFAMYEASIAIQRGTFYRNALKNGC